MYDVIIIGGGPAGLTAAIYAVRAGKSALVIEKNSFGGQISWSPKVENFPSVLSISGTELGDRLLEQAMELGAEAELEEVVSVKAGKELQILCLSGAKYSCRALIIATGAKPRLLGLPDEQRLIGSGVGFCAVCDGAFYKGRTVAVNGGGNSALQEAMLLSDICKKVYLIHRRESFRGEAVLAEELKQKENVELVLNSVITALEGENELSALVVNNDRRIEVDGLFVAVGHQPDTAPFAPLMELDKAGYAAADESCLTRTPGVFVAGDCRTKEVRQVTTAVADGAVAALAACRYIDGQS